MMWGFGCDVKCFRCLSLGFFFSFCDDGNFERGLWGCVG